MPLKHPVTAGSPRSRPPWGGCAGQQPPAVARLCVGAGSAASPPGELGRLRAARCVADSRAVCGQTWGRGVAAVALSWEKRLLSKSCLVQSLFLELFLLDNKIKHHNRCCSTHKSEMIAIW